MKKRYSIGFFCFACCALLLLTAVYQIRYRKAYEEVERLEAQLAETERKKHQCRWNGKKREWIFPERKEWIPCSLSRGRRDIL